MFSFPENKPLHTLTLCAILLCSAQLAVPALAAPTGSIISHRQSVEGAATDYTRYVYITAVCSVDNSLSYTTAYAEIANQMTLVQGNDIYHAWHYGTDPKQITVNPLTTRESTRRFGGVQAMRDWLYGSDLRLAASDSQPYTGGTGTILDEDTIAFYFVP